MLVRGWANNLNREEPNVIVRNEYLQYKVSYMWLRVGTLRIFNYGYDSFEGYQGYHVKIYIDSNPKIPFVKVHDVYETIMNDELAPIYFVAWEKKEDYVLKTIYEFRYTEKDSSIRAMEIRIYPDRKVLQTDTIIPIHHVFRDAISLLFFARAFSHKPAEKFFLPTFALLKKENCYFKSSGMVKEIKYRDRKVKTYYLDGKIKFIGIVGIKDDFKGWFSMDSQRVPLKAKMKAFFGSISIDLEEFRNWNFSTVQ
jgi:hypothetical protein